MSGATAESPRPEPPRRGLRAPGFAANLVTRTATTVVAVPAVLAVFFLAPPWATIALVAAALGLGLHEFFGLLRARGVRPMRAVGVLLAAGSFADVVWPGWLAVPTAPLAVLLLFVVALGTYGPGFESVTAGGTTLLGAAYLGALGGTVAAIRILSPAVGAWRLTLLLAVIALSDTFAFFLGHAFGRHRLAPAVSPGKSVEGAVGGLVGGGLGALAVRQLGLPDLPALHAAGLGLAVAAMGILGDLAESLLKRWAGVKDSGGLFPGHGGMLDRVDGLLFGAPVLYYYFQYVR